MRDSNDTLTVLGVLGTDPESKLTPNGIPITKFRMASTQRKFDKATNSWVDGNTNWYTVSAFRSLATHASETLHKGDPVIVSGRLRLRAWDTGEKQGLAVDLEADVIGLDLQWGTATYARSTQSRALNGATTAGDVATEAVPPEAWAEPEPTSERHSASNSAHKTETEPTPF